MDMRQKKFIDNFFFFSLYFISPFSFRINHLPYFFLSLFLFYFILFYSIFFFLMSCFFTSYSNSFFTLWLLFRSMHFLLSQLRLASNYLFPSLSIQIQQNRNWHRILHIYLNYISIFPFLHQDQSIAPINAHLHGLHTKMLFRNQWVE